MYRSALECLEEAVFLCDPKGRVAFMNSAAQRVTGWHSPDALNRTIPEILGEIDDPGWVAALKNTDQPHHGFLEVGGEAMNYRAKPLFKDGLFCGSTIILKSLSEPSQWKLWNPKSPSSGENRSAKYDLQRKDRILAGAVLATHQLLITGEKDLAMKQALEILGCSANVDRVFIFEKCPANWEAEVQGDEPFFLLKYDFSMNSVDSQIKPCVCCLSLDTSSHWFETLSGGMPLKGAVRALPPGPKKLLEQLQIVSFLIVPIFAKGSLWGFIGFGDCSRERIWTWNEVSILLTMTSAIGGALARWDAQDALRKSEEKYRELVESSNSIIMRRDIHGNILFFNKYAQNFFGYSEDEIIGRNVIGSIVPPEETTGRDLRSMIEEIGKHPESYAVNVNENVLSNGKRVWIAWTNRPILNDHGDIVEILCIGNDITERMQAQRRLKAAHEELLGIIEFLPDATFVIDKERKVVAWNRSMEELTGVGKQSILGKGDCVYSLPFYGKPMPMLIDLVENAKEDKDSAYLYVEKKDGKLYSESFAPSLFGGKGAYVWATASPLYDGEGNVVGAIESIRNITDQKLASEELKQRDVLLAGVAAAANALLAVHNYDVEIMDALEILGLSADVDRATVFENRESEGEPVACLKYEWSRDTVAPQKNDPVMQNRSYVRHFPRWYSAFLAGDVISGPVSSYPEQEIAILSRRNVLSMIAIPIAIDGCLWGFLSFEDCQAERRWNKTEISILRAAAGSIGATIERKMVEEDLRGTRDYLENLIEYANSPIIVWDPSLRITRFNKAFERLTGRRAHELLGRPVAQLFPEENKSRSSEYLNRTLCGERLEEVEIPVTHIDGRIRTILWNSATLYDKDGTTVIATIAQGQDITERKNAQEQILFQASLLDQVRNAVIATDLRGNIIYWNGFAEALHQWQAKDILGRNIAETIVPAEQRAAMASIMKAIAHQGYYEGELPVKRKDGSTFPAYYVLNILKDIEGKSIGFVGVSIDITERKKAEEDLRRAKEEAESATKAKSEFLANMSHEIRTPMNAVIGLTSLLLSSEIDGEEREYVETIRSSGDILISTINDILDFSKIEGGKMELESQPFDLVECIEASLDLVSQAAAKKGLRLSYLVESKVPRMIVGDLTRLRQILVNLLSNAVKFTEAGTISMAVSARPCGKMHEIRFQIKDTGIGISPDRMVRLFHSFSQGDASTTRKYGGTGLGLAISKRLAELMGGAVRAESEPGVGSTFHFTILAETVPDPLSKELRGKRLLIASKDNRLVETLCVHLGSLSLKPEIAGSAKVALDMLSERRFDLLILDSNLEGREELVEMIEAQALEAIVVQMPLDGESTSFAVSTSIVPSALGEEIRDVLCKMPLQRTIPM